MTSPLPSSADVVIVGGGHNGLTAATYLARAGYSVVVMEAQDHVGGAAVSANTFPATRQSFPATPTLSASCPKKSKTTWGLTFL